MHGETKVLPHRKSRNGRKTWSISSLSARFSDRWLSGLHPPKSVCVALRTEIDKWVWQYSNKANSSYCTHALETTLWQDQSRSLPLSFFLFSFLFPVFAFFRGRYRVADLWPPVALERTSLWRCVSQQSFVCYTCTTSDRYQNPEWCKNNFLTKPFNFIWSNSIIVLWCFDRLF